MACEHFYNGQWYKESELLAIYNKEKNVPTDREFSKQEGDLSVSQSLLPNVIIQEVFNKTKNIGFQKLIYDNGEIKYQRNNNFDIYSQDYDNEGKLNQSYSENQKSVDNYNKLSDSEYINEVLNGKKLTELPFLQKKEAPIPSKASAKTLSLIREWMKRLGISEKPVNEIVVNGEILGANGVAYPLQKLVEIVKGTEATSLPEESMHIAVEIIEQTNPKLFNDMLNKIGQYDIYKRTFSAYRSDLNYQKEGKADIRKIKKEAIAKILVEHIIQQSEETTEKPENLARVQTWWEQIKEWILRLIGKAGFDPFSVAAEGVLSNQLEGEITTDSGIFLQKTAENSQEKLFTDIKTNKGVPISKDFSIKKKDRKGNPKEAYFINGKEVENRLSDQIKAFYRQLFHNKEISPTEEEQAINDIFAEKGTVGHADMQYAGTVLVDENTGLLRNIPLDDSGYISQINPKDNTMYKLLKKNLQDRLALYPKGTRFLFEVRMYDPKDDMGTTADFLSISDRGKVGILDWKFINLNTDKYSEIPWYKVEAWNKQLSITKQVLINNYGVKKEDFDYQHTEMIPILAKYKFFKRDKNGLIPPQQLVGIKIGNVNVKNEENAYLLPVALPEQRTGDKKVDELLDKLQKLQESIENIKSLSDRGRKNKIELLNSLFNARRQLQIRQNIRPTMEFAQVLNRQVEVFVKNFNENTSKKTVDDLGKAAISDLGLAIIRFSNSLTIFEDTHILLKNHFRGATLSEEDKKLYEELKDTAEQTQLVLSDLNDVMEIYNDKFLGGFSGIANLTSVEKKRQWHDGLFSPTSEQQIGTVQAATEILQGAIEKTDLEQSDESRKLVDMEKRYDEWAKGKGLNKKNKFDTIKKKDKNELIDEFSPEFYNTLETKIKENDVTWIKNNIDVGEFSKANSEELVKEKDRIDNNDGLTDEQKEDKKRAAEKQFDISKSTSLGWYNYSLLKKFPLRAKWESREFKELHSKGNEVPLELYDYIIGRNKYYESIGYISRGSARKFLPFVRKTLMEKLIKGKNKTSEVFYEILKSISIDEGTVGFGEIDPITKQVVRKIPKYFTRDTGDQISEELFQSLNAYNRMAIGYKNMQEVEGMIWMLDKLEKSKEVYRTNSFGKLIPKEGSTEFETEANERNYKIFRELTDAVLYGTRYIAEEDTALGKIGEWGKKINDKLGIKVLPEKFAKGVEGRTISSNALFHAMNSAFQLRVLGLNPLSAISNFVGGNLQADINAGRWYTKREFERNLFYVFSERLGENRQKAIKMIEYFNPFPAEYQRKISRILADNKLSDASIQEVLMIMMRSSDLNVQTNIFYSLIDNAIVVDGELHNARQYVAHLPEFNNIYSAGGIEQTKKLLEAKEKKIEELKKEKGIYNFAKINDKGELEIDGIERQSKGVFELRRISAAQAKDALGNLSEVDKRRINLIIYGKSMMVFKNWIPSLITKRLKGLQYRQDIKSYEWGRYRTVMSALMTDTKAALGAIIKTLIPFYDGTLSDSTLSMMEKMYDKKTRDYRESTGKELNMSLDEFSDMVRDNIKAQARDLLFYLALLTLYMVVKAYAPDDDDDDRTKNYHKFMLRAADKISDEVGFFYNPFSIQQIGNGTMFPAFGLLTDFANLMTNFGSDVLGIWDEDFAKKGHTFKYAMKHIPGINVFSTQFLPFISPETAKELGIRMASQSRIH